MTKPRRLSTSLFRIILVALILSACQRVRGQPAEQVNLPNLAIPTLGGTHFWSDHVNWHDWRIQRNALTGHFRLLDDRNRRRAWGTFRQCRDRLDAVRAERFFPPLKSEAVILLHGLGRSRIAMAGMASYIEENTEYTVVNFTYSSMREEMAGNAAALKTMIDDLDGVERVHFVAHSLGNLVVRHYLADRAKETEEGESRRTVGRIVMLAPPNGGAKMAENFRDSRLLAFLFGSSITEVARNWAELEERLIVPDCQFGIIAGNKGQNPLLEGANDLVLTVEETKLRGAHDFCEIPVFHNGINDSPQVQECTLRFLRRGYFVSEDDRNPIR